MLIYQVLRLKKFLCFSNLLKGGALFGAPKIENLIPINSRGKHDNNQTTHSSIPYLCCLLLYRGLAFTFPNMKKYIVLILACANTILGFAQSATDFTVNDCDGNSYNLFNDLDAGKIVVITWTMPCGSCIGGSLTAYNISQSYESTHPGKVKMLLVDDFGNTPCAAIKSWGLSNGMTRAINFSDPAIRMNDYGIAGMPKTVAIAPDHSVIFNQNNGVNADNLKAAIDAALTTTSVTKLNPTISNATIFPNPAGNDITVQLQMVKGSTVEIDLFDLEGKLIQETFNGYCPAGQNLIPLAFPKMNNGLYQIRISTEDDFITRQLLIAR